MIGFDGLRTKEQAAMSEKLLRREDSGVTQTMIDRMVQRFLSWTLPKDFAPDCGIKFSPAADTMGYPATWPTGTNLFTAMQARAMVAHMLDGAVREDRERVARFIESREHVPDGEGRGSKELADLVRGLA